MRKSEEHNNTPFISYSQCPRRGKHVLLNAARVFGAQALTNHVRFGNSGTPFFVFVLFFVFITAVTVFCYESMFEQRFSVPPLPQ